eukprot:6191733-Pleurochrysis_carterae.AAC.1
MPCAEGTSGFSQWQEYPLPHFNTSHARRSPPQRESTPRASSSSSSSSPPPQSPPPPPPPPPPPRHSRSSPPLAPQRSRRVELAAQTCGVQRGARAKLRAHAHALHRSKLREGAYARRRVRHEAVSFNKATNQV